MKATINCNRCNLPYTFPGISFDEEGVCNLCREHEKSNISLNYLGKDALKKYILTINEQYPYRNPDYDCVVAFSGGMDSTYLLYVLVRELNLRVLAVTLRHDYMPEETLDNIRNITKSLGVSHLFVNNIYLNEHARNLIKDWSFNPSYQGLVSFCTGCRYGLDVLLPEIVSDNHLHVLVSGQTPYEETKYKMHLAMIDPNNPSSLGLGLGYGREVLRNITYLRHPGSLAFQVKEFGCHKNIDSRFKKHEVVSIRPFFDYIEWDIQAVNDTLSLLEWKTSNAFSNKWRSDCVINLIRQYYYKRFLGYNDYNVKMAMLLRSGKSDNKKETHSDNTDERIIKKLLKEFFDIEYDEVEQRIRKNGGP